MQQPHLSTRPDPDRWADWFSPGRYALFLVLLLLATFPHVLLGWQTFVIRDYGLFSYPFAYLQRENFWHGELPLWNPYSDCGIPFLAQWNTMSLYPPALFYLLLPFTWAYAVLCLVHLWLAGFGMYWLVRRWTGNQFAAAFAGLVFAFNGFTLNMLIWPNHIASLGWAPWVILCVQRAWQEGGRKIPLAALVGAMQMLAGGPETIFFTWVLLVFLCLAQLVGAIRSGLRIGFAAAWRFPIVVLLVGGLAAVQLLPFLDLMAHSQRESGYADTRWSMPGTGWMNFLVPLAYTHKWNLGVFFQYDQGWTSSYYLGMGTMLLVLAVMWLQFRSKPGKEGGMLSRGTVWMLLVLAVLAVLVSMGDQTFVSRLLRRLVPAMSLMTFPIKYVILAVLIAPVLAAVALDRWLAARAEADQESPVRPMAISTAMLLGGIALVLFWTGRWPGRADDYHATFLNGLTRAAFLLAEAGLLFALMRTGASSWRRWVPLALLMVTWLDLHTHMPNQNPTAAPSVCQPGAARARLAMQPQPVLGGSRAMVSPTAARGFLKTTMDAENNFLVKRLGLFANANLLDAVPKVDGFHSLYPREYGRLMSLVYNPSNALNPRLLDFMGVSQITAPGEFVKWQPRDTFLPLVTAGQRPVFLDDLNALSATYQSDFDPTVVVFLSEKDRSRVTATNQTRARVLSSKFASGRVDIEVEADEASLVVLAQTYFHSWRAYVDGGPVPLLRANHAFQALQVPSGRHQVKVVYEDRAFKTGLGISAISALACCLMAMLPGRKAGALPS